MNQNLETSTIIQYVDEAKTLPDGSKVIYAENKKNLVIYHKIPFEKSDTYVFDRVSGNVTINGKHGSLIDKKNMIKLGSQFLSNCSEDELITLNVQSKKSL